MSQINKDYKKYLDISKNEVKTKYRAIVRLSLEEYKIFDNELLDEDEIEMLAGDQAASYSVPGTFEIEFPEQGTSVNIFLPYTVNLMKTDDFVANSKEMIFYYEENDVIFTAFVKKSDTNIEIVNNLMENRVKYLRGFISQQHEAIWNQLSATTNTKAIHLSLILSMLYAKVENGENKLIRYTKDQIYDAAYAINTKESSHIFNVGAQSQNYGYSKEAIFQNIFKNKRMKMTPFKDYNEETDPGFSLSEIKNIAQLKQENKNEGTPLSSTISSSPNQALIYKLHDASKDIKSRMSATYSDLENVMAGRYDELINKKNNNDEIF